MFCSTFWKNGTKMMLSVTDIKSLFLPFFDFHSPFYIHEMDAKETGV
jgi:hypothetical protein